MEQTTEKNEPRNPANQNKNVRCYNITPNGPSSIYICCHSIKPKRQVVACVVVKWDRHTCSNRGESCVCSNWFDTFCLPCPREKRPPPPPPPPPKWFTRRLGLNNWTTACRVCQFSSVTDATGRITTPILANPPPHPRTRRPMTVCLAREGRTAAPRAARTRSSSVSLAVLSVGEDMGEDGEESSSALGVYDGHEWCRAMKLHCCSGFPGESNRQPSGCVIRN